MQPLKYFINCFTEDFINFSSRARREEFWYYTLFRLVISIILMTFVIISSLLQINSLIIASIIALILFMLISFIPTLAVTVRRFHDVGMSGWMYLINFIPFGGLFIIIKLIEDGNPYTNKYGNDPKGRGLDFNFETIHNQNI